MILSAAILVGCGHQHVFSEATCDTPATCAEDGVTEGEALGHDFLEATCDAPKTCSRCGKIEGEALGHDFAEATCKAPATCKVCEKTEGEALEHNFAPATLDSPKTCKECGLTEGEKVSVKVIDTKLKGASILDDDRFIKINGWDFTIYDANGKVIKRFEPDLPDMMISSIVGNEIVVMGDTSRGVEVIIYDKDGEIICSGEILRSDYSLVPDFNDDWTYAKYAGEDDIEIYNVHSGHIICEIIPSKGDFFTTKEGIEVTIGEEENWPETKSKDNIKGYEYTAPINGYLVNFADDDTWGFVDADGNEIVRYFDVCSYTLSGYTLATDDRVTYSIIDTEQNVIAKDFIEGKGSAISSNGGACEYIKITKADNTVSFVKIE